MSTRTEHELNRIENVDELQIAPVGRAGALRAPTTIWVVRAGDDLYVRAAYGPETGWHRVARASRQARIWAAGGVEKDVTLEDVQGAVLEHVDAAYRQKYGRYAQSIVEGITNDQARATTLRLVPRAERS